jgi:hypothetical protein
MKTTAILLTAATSLFLSACAGTSSSVKPYTKNTCVVSGNTLGSMGPVITEVHNGQEVKFCCSPCIKKFAADPAKYLSKL